MMEYGALCVVPVLIAVVGAIITKKAFESLLLGSFIGAIMVYGKSFLIDWATLLQTTAADNIWLFMLMGLFGGLIAILTQGKGTAGFAKLANKLCNTTRKTMLTTFVLGVVIFIDDYLNMMTVGTCMRSVYDERKIPRESLAYMLDSTGTPVCMLLPFSTWGVFYIALFMKQDAVAELGYSSGVSMFMHILPFNFYCLITVLFVFLFALGIMPKIGKMGKAYQRTEKTGYTYEQTQANIEKNKAVEQAAEDGNIWDFIIPMIVLILFTFLVEILTGVIAAILVALVMYLPRKIMTLTQWSTALIKGFGDMLPVLAALLAAFMVAGISDEMGLTNWVIDSVKSFSLPQIYPMIIFLVMAAITFSTGSIWGSSTIAVPIVIPLAASLDANVMLTVAAVMAGGTFGSHACFFADATLLAAESSKIEVMDHNLTQIPYVLIATALTCIGLVICGFIMV